MFELSNAMLPAVFSYFFVVNADGHDYNTTQRLQHHTPIVHSQQTSRRVTVTLVAYGSGKRMVTGTRAGSRIQTRNFKRRFLPHHKSQRRDIWCTNSPVVSCFNPKFVDRSVPYEAKQRRVKFRRCFGNIPLAECNVSVPNVRSSGTEPKAPVTDYRNRGSGNHTRG